MRYLKIFLAPLLLILAVTLQVNAQVVKTPDSNAQVVTNSDMPVRGLTKVQVESRFGELARSLLVSLPSIVGIMAITPSSLKIIT